MTTKSCVSWSKFDLVWALNLFGTAVGAGVLFLPINAGKGGFWPLVCMTLLVGPMTYLAHRGLTVLSYLLPKAAVILLKSWKNILGKLQENSLLYFISSRFFLFC